MKKLKAFLSKLARPEKKQKRLSTKKAVDISVKKYRKAYELLEKNEKTKKHAPFLDDSENIKKYFHQV